MPYADVMDRGWNTTGPQTGLLQGEVGALIPEDVSKEIIQGVLEKSVALKMFRHRQMGTAQTRLPVLSALPNAYFVSGDTAMKNTTAASWSNVYLNVEEIAAICVIPEKVLDDTSYDLWAEMKPLLEEAIAIALDGAVFFGIGTPASWPTAIGPAAVAAGNVVVCGTGVDYADDVNLGIAAVEADGYIPNGFFARMQVRSKLRGLRDTTRGFLFEPDPGGPAGPNLPIQFGQLFGEPIYFSRGGFANFNTGFATTNYSLITGDFTQAILGVRQDITYKMLDQAVITDNTGPNALIQYNLPQQDMLAMRVVARYAFAVPNPINRLNATWPATNRYPFAVLQQKQTTPGGEV